MNVLEYEIQDGEELKNIAVKFGGTVPEILDFHNSNSALTQQIHSDYIPFHIKTFLLKADEISDERSAIDHKTDDSPIKLRFAEKSSYKIAISTSLYYMGKLISENKIESIWQLHYDEKDHSIVVEVLGKKYEKVDGQIKPLLEIVDKINKSTDVLHLQLADDQTIKRVININSVLDRWEHIKFEDIKFHELEDDYFKLIVESFDKEFGNLSESLEKNILYQIFFYPQGKIYLPISKPIKITENRRTISQLFPQQGISYDLFATGKWDHQKISVSCSAEKTKEWNAELLETEFKKNYAQLLKEPFDFSFTLDSKYEYDLDGILQKSKSYVKEQASKELFYIGDYEITRLPMS